MLNTTLYQELGHDFYVELLEHTGAKVSNEVKKAKPPKPAPDHTFDDCGRPWKCQTHRREYRQKLAERKRQQDEARRVEQKARFYASLAKTR